MPQQARYRALSLSAFALGWAMAAGFGAQAGEPADMSLELNKLEPGDKGCRAYMVIDNKADIAFSAFKLDLVVFRPDGVIGKRFVLDLAPIKPRKRSVKIFSMDDTPCDGAGSILINEIAECRSESGPVERCLDRLEVRSLSPVQFTK